MSAAGSRTTDLGFLLAKASQRWNELLAEQLRAHGFAEVRPSYGSVLVPLFDQDSLRLGELAERSRLAKQTMTTMVRLVERDGLVERVPDPDDRRATLVRLTPRGRSLARVAQDLLARVEGAATSQLTRSERESLRSALMRIAQVTTAAAPVRRSAAQA
jgi:DNA-binding MarR family transcriptional regulator